MTLSTACVVMTVTACVLGAWGITKDVLAYRRRTKQNGSFREGQS